MLFDRQILSIAWALQIHNFREQGIFGPGVEASGDPPVRVASRGVITTKICTRIMSINTKKYYYGY